MRRRFRRALKREKDLRRRERKRLEGSWMRRIDPGNREKLER